MSDLSARGGAHCDEPGCHKLDFLPFTCEKCHRTFCLDHRDSSHHSCTFDITAQRTMPTCPICQQVIFVSAGESSDGKVNAHILSGCKAGLMKEVEGRVKAKQSTALRCDFIDGCRNKEGYSTIQCKRCHRQFCLSHRFPEQHKCPSLTSSNSLTPPPDKHSKGKALLEKVRREREEKEAKAVNIPKKSQPQRRAQTTTLQQIRQQMGVMSNYIAESVMSTLSPSLPPSTSPSPSPTPSPPPPTSSPPPPPSLSMRKAAKGDDRIPVDDRLYLTVDSSPLGRVRSPSPCFVSRQWTVGRAMDALCECVGVENENHMEGKRKVGLGCERSMGKKLLPNDLPLHLLAPAVLNGDTVQLRWREDDKKEKEVT